MVSHLETEEKDNWEMTYCNQICDVKYLTWEKLGTRREREFQSDEHFVSFHMRKVFFEPSHDTLKLVLRLASEIFDNLDYLTILRFRKPPLWN